jgi:hypothetical protein
MFVSLAYSLLLCLFSLHSIPFLISPPSFPSLTSLLPPPPLPPFLSTSPSSSMYLGVSTQWGRTYGTLHATYVHKIKTSHTSLSPSHPSSYTAHHITVFFCSDASTLSRNIPLLTLSYDSPPPRFHPTPPHTIATHTYHRHRHIPHPTHCNLH